MRLIVSVLLILVAYNSCFAGWYECYNFQGKIGKYPIQLSFQIRDGYFGETDKKEHNVIGTYYYERYREPIYIDGTYNRDSEVITLTEHINGEESARLIFSFSKSNSNSTGKWTSLSSSRELSLELNYTSELVDTGSQEFQNIAIPQQSSNALHYFVGVYAKSAKSSRARMTHLNIYSKATGELVQSLDFSNEEFGFGNVWTIIYGNVTASENEFYIWINQGRMGSEEYYKYSLESKSYEWSVNEQTYGY